MNFRCSESVSHLLLFLNLYYTFLYVDIVKVGWCRMLFLGGGNLCISFKNYCSSGDLYKSLLYILFIDKIKFLLNTVFCVHFSIQ